MKKHHQFLAAAFVLAVLVSACLWHRWRQGEPRRHCLATLHQLDAALRSADSSTLPEILLLPAALQNRTAAEQVEFLRKALHDELSPEGLAMLEKQGRFGPLTNLFPAEAQAWTAQAGVKPEDCVAFRLDRTNAPRAEVVLFRDSAIRNPHSEFFASTT